MKTLFESSSSRPLAERLRPSALNEVVGQDHLIGTGAPLRRMIDEGCFRSIVLWGPPGTGKTTIARLLSAQTDLHFHSLSAVFSGVSDLRKIFAEAKQRKEIGSGTLLFVDEIHRFNRSQQDSFLQYVEDGTVILIGASTENPSFELNAPLLSRCQVLLLRRLDEKALEDLLVRAELIEERTLPLGHDARNALKLMADGDGRYLLNMAEELFRHPVENKFDIGELGNIIQKKVPLYDKAQESHYNLISALHKSIRGSDVDAALYWLARMLNGGEEPKYIMRRLVRFAVEDVGMADPMALVQSISGWQAFERIGSPEGELILAQITIYMATAPKSNSTYKAFNEAIDFAKENGSLTPPKHALNAPTNLLREIGYGFGYEYDHNTKNGFSGQSYFPDNLPREQFYRPTNRGFEDNIKKRLEEWKKFRDRNGKDLMP